MSSFKISLIAVLTAFIAACGGGGGGDSSSSNGKAFFAVTGVKNSGPYIVCIDASYEDPNTANGRAVSTSIVNYYGLTGNYTVLSGTGDSCRDKYPLANTVISTTFYNSSVRGTPAPVAAPVATPAPSVTSTPNTGSTGGTSTTVEIATQCISLNRQVNRWVEMTNNCSYAIEATWCYLNLDCKYGSWGTSNLGTIAAGATRSASTLSSNSSAYDLRVFACKGANTSPAEISDNVFVCNP